MEHYDKEWWARQNYSDPLPRGVKLRRLLWLAVWTLFAKWMPYFVGRRWRVALLSMFGMKHNGHIGVYPSCKVWAPWNVEMGSWVAIDDEVNLYSAAKITIGTKVAISREAFICTASHDMHQAEPSACHRANNNLRRRVDRGAGDCPPRSDNRRRRGRRRRRGGYKRRRAVCGGGRKSGEVHQEA